MRHFNRELRASLDVIFTMKHKIFDILFEIKGNYSRVGLIMCISSIIFGIHTNNIYANDIPVTYLNIESTPIKHFRRTKPTQKKFGKVEFIGGLELSASNNIFGGLSGLIIQEKGRKLLAVSDFGYWLSADLKYNENGTLAAVQNARMAPFVNELGKVIKPNKELTDAEALTLHDGRYIVAFERDNRIYSYKFSDIAKQGKASFVKTPFQINKLRSNKGIEAISFRPGTKYISKSILAIAEDTDIENGLISGWLFNNNKSFQIFFKQQDNFDITGATFTPSGDLLLIERRFNFRDGFRVRLRRYGYFDILPNSIQKGELLLDSNLAFEIDNMEGISFHRNGKFEDIITMVSDDNGSPLQRTLLLQFKITK